MTGIPCEECEQPLESEYRNHYCERCYGEALAKLRKARERIRELETEKSWTDNPESMGR